MSDTDYSARACVALTKAALEIEVDLNSLKTVTPLILLKAIREKVISRISEPVPFDELENQPLIFKINYAHHMGVPREEIIRRLSVDSKKVNDCLWFYNNKSVRHTITYKEKIIQFLKDQNKKSC